MKTNDLYNQMLSAYELATEQQRRNAVFEINQQIILAGLYSGGFFNEAAFYGGTCLRIFHGLQRFSEDMDFSLLSSNENFDFSQYFQPIVDVFSLVGRQVEIKKKVTMFANANAMTTVGRRSLEALRLQPLGKPPQCFS